MAENHGDVRVVDYLIGLTQIFFDDKRHGFAR